MLYLQAPTGFTVAPGQIGVTQEGGSWKILLPDIAAGGSVDVPVTVLSDGSTAGQCSTFGAGSEGGPFNTNATGNSASYSVGVSPGADAPTINNVTANTVKDKQTTVIATITPAVAGDTLSLTEIAGTGTLSLVLANNVEEVVYTAPASTSTSTVDAVSTRSPRTARLR